MNLDWNFGALGDGLRCYESQEFFLAHEYWESVWLKCEEPERSFLQALIQLAVAFHHLQRDNSRGATSMLKKALRRLERYPAIFQSVLVEPLRAEAGAMLKALEGADTRMDLPFPQIRFVPSTSGGEKVGTQVE